MRVAYVGSKPLKRDTVNDPPTGYVWSEENGYVVDVLDSQQAARFLKYDSIWRPAPDVEAPEVQPEAPDVEASKGRKGQV